MHSISTETRIRIAVTGVVQGVGFRPFVYNLALQHKLSGWVRNNNGVVQIEIQGASAAVDAFIKQLKFQPPSLAQIAQIVTESIHLIPGPERSFEILESTASLAIQQKFVPADSATCHECLSELFDSSNRRYRYPFINCTNCGPRFTIISSLPYDRPGTAMAPFKMCVSCQQEYDDPENRRFHAQPNACATCGPSLTFISATNGTSRHDSALHSAIEQLRNGQIVAIKGLGGFHLVCDATNAAAVNELRQRKLRAKKPFALMMPNLDMVRKYCHCSAQEEDELVSNSRPIVLLKTLCRSNLPDAVAPGLDCLGVMLPYTPLHHLLTTEFNGPLIATSGNLSEEPIAIDNAEARHRLAKIADSFLLHDRGIQSRYDDSVVTFVAENRIVLRRARGIAPLAIKLPFTANTQALACGAHLKNTFCLVQNDQAYVSQHIGNLENIETLEHFEGTLDTYRKLFGVTPDLIVHDCHPDYLSTVFAHELAAKETLARFEVQHHHAHIVSCMIEHGLTQPVIGVAFDGSGYGLDDTLWGGEFLLATLTGSQRLAHFKPVRLPGGSLGVREPWRMALSYIYDSSSQYVGASLGHFADTVAAHHGHSAFELVKKQICNGLNSPLTSSCGRLFDAMSALLGICHKAEYEGEAAIKLECVANKAAYDYYSACPTLYPFELAGDQPPFVVDTKPILEAAYDEYLEGVRSECIAARFHHTIAQLILDICRRLRTITGIQIVCLSGGVFQNAVLLKLSHQLLTADGFDVFFPRQLPANDGGLSLGQAIIALANAGAITLRR